MINEEISNRVVNIEVNVLKATYQEILSQVKKLQQRSKQRGGLDKLIKAEGNEIKLKDMVTERKYKNFIFYSLNRNGIQEASTWFDRFQK